MISHSSTLHSLNHTNKN